ncbi:MAG: hypothetical protein V1913_11040, partial [Fibrobacterota bacterium]
MESKQFTFSFLIEPFKAFFTAMRVHYAVLALLPFLAGILCAREAFSGRSLTAILPIVLVAAAYLFAVYRAGLPKRALFWLLLLPAGALLTLIPLRAPYDSGFAPYLGLDSSVVQGCITRE